MNEIEYKETFTKSDVPLKNIDYVLNQIIECHPSEKGWIVVAPEIIPNRDGYTATLKVPLTKYHAEKGHTR